MAGAGPGWIPVVFRRVECKVPDQPTCKGTESSTSHSSSAHFFFVTETAEAGRRGAATRGKLPRGVFGGGWRGNWRGGHFHVEHNRACRPRKEWPPRAYLQKYKSSAQLHFPRRGISQNSARDPDSTIVFAAAGCCETWCQPQTTN